jgi:hypothetical protein
LRTIALITITLLVSTIDARAQSLSTRLSQLFTEQQPSLDFVADEHAAEMSFHSLHELISIEVDSLPVPSSGGGFVYRFNRTLGTVERASDSFGPFFTESILRGGRDQVGIGLRYQFRSFNSLQGIHLESGGLLTSATREAGTSEPFSVDTMQLTLDASTISLVGTYGVTDRFSVGGRIPVSNVRFRGQRVRATNGQSSVQSTQSGSVTGLGDVSLNARYRFFDEGVSGVAVGTDLKLPTGRELDLLGSGKFGARFLAIGTWERRRLATHVNGVVSVGGASDEILVSAAATYAVTPRLTVIGEYIGRHLARLHRIVGVYELDSQHPQRETMRLLHGDRHLHATFVSTGAKWNVARSWLLNGNVLIRVDEGGLRARVTPTIALEFDFQQ